MFSGGNFLPLMQSLCCDCNTSRLVNGIAEILTLLTPISLVIFYSYDLYINGNEKELIAWFSAGGFVLITFPVSLYLIIQHLTHWYMPNVQKYVVRIIWMVPIYSVESWFSLRFREFALYIETIRECYESYVIYSFMYYLIALLGHETHLIAILRNKPKERGNHLFPFNRYFSPWDLGHNYLHHCKLGVFQYVLIKNISAIISIILEKNGLFVEGSFSFSHGYIYVAVINTASQLWALYCLSMFYGVFQEELKSWNPVGKFLSVKLVIFFTWWQSLMVNFATDSHWLPEESMQGWTISEINKGLQDYLICIEMLVAAIAYNYTFTHKDYIRAKSKKHIPVSPSPPPTAINRRVNYLHTTGHNEAGGDIDDDLSGAEDACEELLHTPFKSGVDESVIIDVVCEHDEEMDGEEDERKPFLSALLQSTLPDDVMKDINRISRGQYLYDLSPQVTLNNAMQECRRSDATVDMGAGSREDIEGFKTSEINDVIFVATAQASQSRGYDITLSSSAGLWPSNRRSPTKRLVLTISDVNEITPLSIENESTVSVSPPGNVM